MKRNLLIILISLSLGFLITTIVTSINNHKHVKPDNTMIHKELVIRDAGKYSSLYVDEISTDRGSQQFGISVNKKGKDLYVYVLGHENSKLQVEDFTNWLVSYYGAEALE